VELADAVNDNEAYAEEVRHSVCSSLCCLRAATRGANYSERPRPWPPRLTDPAQQHAWFISFAPPASQGPGVKSHCDSCRLVLLGGISWQHLSLSGAVWTHGWCCSRRAWQERWEFLPPSCALQVLPLPAQHLVSLSS